MPLFAVLMWYKVYHDVGILYWSIGANQQNWLCYFVPFSEKWHNLVSWLLKNWWYLQIAIFKWAEINSIQKGRDHLLYWNMFYVTITLKSNEGTFSVHNFFSDTLYMGVRTLLCTVHVLPFKLENCLGINDWWWVKNSNWRISMKEHLLNNGDGRWNIKTRE